LGSKKDIFPERGIPLCGLAPQGTASGRLCFNHVMYNKKTGARKGTGINVFRTGGAAFPRKGAVNSERPTLFL